MRKPKSILLDYDLFVDLYVYACRHSEPDDLQYKRLCSGVHKKLDAMMRHDPVFDGAPGCTACKLVHALGLSPFSYTVIDSIMIRRLTIKQIILWSYQEVRNTKRTRFTPENGLLAYYISLYIYPKRFFIILQPHFHTSIRKKLCSFKLTGYYENSVCINEPP